MGTLATATMIAGLAGQAMSAQQSHKMYKMQAKNLQAAQADQEAAAKANAEILQKNSEYREEKRKNLLKAELASQRAAMGASGVGGGGSAAAVQLGLAKSSDREAEYDQEMDRYKLDQITRSLNSSARQNLLEKTDLNYNSLANDLLKTSSLLNTVGGIL